MTVKMTVPMTLCQKPMIAFHWLSDASDEGRMQGKLTGLKEETKFIFKERH